MTKEVIGGLLITSYQHLLYPLQLGIAPPMQVLRPHALVYRLDARRSRDRRRDGTDCCVAGSVRYLELLRQRPVHDDVGDRAALVLRVKAHGVFCPFLLLSTRLTLPCLVSFHLPHLT